MNKTVIKFSQKTVEFQKTKWSIIIFSSMILTSYLVQQILFATGVMKLNDTLITDSESWKPFINSALQLIGSIGIVVNLTLIARIDKRFIWASWVGNTLLLLYAISMKTWFEFLRRLLFLGFYQLQHYKWTKSIKEGGVIQPANVKEIFTAGMIIAAVIGGLGYSFTLIPETHILHNPSPWLDSGQFIFAILGVVFGIIKRRESPLLYTISNFLLVAMYITLQQWTAVVSSSIFAIITISSTINWYTKVE